MRTISTNQRFHRAALTTSPFFFRGLGRLGDDPATIAQIIDAGYDPTAQNVTYTVDANGNVTQNLTVTATPITSAAPPQTPISPLLIILGVAGVLLYHAGKHS